MNKCYIFGAGEGLPQFLDNDDSDLVIAADKGYEALQKLNIEPDIIIGDFDSLDYTPKGENVIALPIKKDDTDTLFAVKTGLEKGYRHFYLYGGTGGRFDHTLANLQTLCFIAEKGGIGFLCGKDFTATAIKNTSLGFSSAAKGNISVFSATTVCEGVNIKGLLYETQNAELSNSFPLGVSNEFLSQEAEISATNGTLIIIWQGTEKDIIL
ncbi:MAG: thiamine diphosphokinase [Ruminococcaceae bacterium]|nr:thiamine diphosphokinase [Oscillospiraceae bacterium]